MRFSWVVLWAAAVLALAKENCSAKALNRGSVNLLTKLLESLRSLVSTCFMKALA